MRVFLTSLFAAIVIAGGAMYVLECWQRRADDAFTSPTSVRITHEESGHNLIGKSDRRRRLPPFARLPPL